MSEILFTMDVEDPDQDRDGSFVPPLLAVLDWLQRDDRKGTFFIVGELAERYPQVVTRLIKDGHEVGLHGWRHTDLAELGEKRFRRETHKGKMLIENLTGGPVAGYRAPMFSLTANVPWAPDILKDLGFLYSSSVLPANNPRYSYPGQPRQLYTWPCGLIEIPAPVAPVISTPFLGGIYFRYLPNFLIRYLHVYGGEHQVPWFYCHPYDFYWDKIYIRMRDTPVWVNALLMGRRKNALKKMQKFFDSYDSNRTMQQYVSDEIVSLT